MIQLGITALAETHEGSHNRLPPVLSTNIRGVTARHEESQPPKKNSMTAWSGTKGQVHDFENEIDRNNFVQLAIGRRNNLAITGRVNLIHVKNGCKRSVRTVNLIAMASNLETMASNLIAMAFNKKSLPV